jgi:hypothetical protein
VSRGEHGVGWDEVDPAPANGGPGAGRLDFVGTALASEERTPFSFASVAIDASALASLDDLANATVEIRDVSLLAHTDGLLLGDVLALEREPGPGARIGGVQGFPPPGMTGLVPAVGLSLDTNPVAPDRKDLQLVLEIRLDAGVPCGAFGGVGVLLAGGGGDTELLAFPQGLLLCGTEGELACVTARRPDVATTVRLLLDGEEPVTCG